MRTIDVHHHFTSPAFTELLRSRGSVSTRGFESYTPAVSLEDMDLGGVAIAMLSVTTPGIWFGSPPETQRLARELNEVGAGMVADHPDRFGLLAVLPFPDVDACLNEIAYAFDVLHADGVGILSSYSNLYLGDAAFTEVFHELDRRNALVFVHASIAECCRNLNPVVPEFMVEYNTDTARTIFSLILSGRAAECPNIRFVFSHGGGTMLALPGRLLGNQLSAAGLAATPDPQSRLGLLRRFSYDVASSVNPVQIAALKTLMTVPQLVFGSDFPFWPSSGVTAAFDGCDLTPAEIQAIDHENALRLIPRLQAHAI